LSGSRRSDGAPTNSGINTIGQANLDGTSVNELFIDTLSAPSGVAVDTLAAPAPGPGPGPRRSRGWSPTFKDSDCPGESSAACWPSSAPRSERSTPAISKPRAAASAPTATMSAPKAITRSMATKPRS
jgi:hypothetical protein